MKQHLLCLILIPAAVAILALGSGCARNRSAASASGKLPQPIPANSFAVGWTSDLNTHGDSLDELHLREKNLFIYTKNDKVWALNRAGGEIAYVAEPQISGGVLRPPLILGKYVVYPCGSTLEVFTDRGRPARTLDLDKSTRSPAAGTGNTIYIGLDHTSGTGVMAQIDITKPYKYVIWQLMTFGPISATPVIYDRIIYCASQDGRIYAVTDERDPVWSLQGANWFQTQGRFVADIKADDYGLYASNTDSKLYCLDRMNGHIKWQYFSGRPLRTAPVVQKDTVYQYVPDKGIAAIDKTQGEFNRQPKWIVPGTVQFLSSDDQNVYLRRDDNHILAVDKQTGQVVFQSKSKDYELFAENPKDSTIYAATRDGHVVAIKPVLKEGQVGTIVMDLKAEPLALAK